MIRNFLFHRVYPERDVLWDPMDVKLFEKCIKHLSNNYDVVRIEDLVKSGNMKGRNKYATINFDDGYKDNIDYAADILAKYHCKASFYVVTDCIDRNVPTWTHILEHTFQHTAHTKIDLTYDFLTPELRISELKTKEERIAYVKKLKPFLKNISHANRTEVLETVIKSFSDAELPKLMMNWDDLKQLHQAGHYIGSHTVTHCMLGTMDNLDEIRYELQHSAQTIQQHLGYFPVTISYPVGSFNETTKKLSKEAGYEIGLAVKQNTYDPQKDDVFEIPRIELYNEPWWKTRLRITNTLENIKTLIGYKK